MTGVDGIPHLTKRGSTIEVRRVPDGPILGRIESGPNMGSWGWTVGLGWHVGLRSFCHALDALMADPAFGVDVHDEGRPLNGGSDGPAILGPSGNAPSRGVGDDR